MRCTYFIYFIIFTLSELICTCITLKQYQLSFNKNRTLFYVCRTIRWYVTVEITFIRESIQGDEQTTATFRSTPEIMADVSAYDQRELLVILFSLVANFLSVGSGWRFDLVQSLAISLCAFRPTVGAGSYIQTPKSLHSKVVFNIQILMTITVSSGPFSDIFIEQISTPMNCTTTRNILTKWTSQDSISLSNSLTRLNSRRSRYANVLM